MSNTINIFNTLPQHQSDSEDEGQQVQPQKGQTQNRRQQDEKPKRGQQQDTRQPQKQQQAPKQGRTGVQGDLSKKEDRDYHSHNKEFHKQQKDDLEKPHPNDRHSGHGGSAYGVKPKKGGAGKGNWGKEEQTGEAGSPVEGGQEKPKEEEKASLTLQEYYQQQRLAQNQPQVNEAKAKITSDQLLKEMGTATLLKGRTAQAVDDRKAGKKKETLDVDHHAGITTEHANLLNFRTGFIEKEYKPRDREEGGDFKKRDNRRREEKDQEGEKQAVAGETEGQTAETQVAEGTQETEQREGQGNRRRQGGYQDRYQGGYQGERRGYGNRGNRGYGKRYNQEGEGEGRFQGDEQGEQGVSTGYTYKGGRGGNRGQGGYRGGQNRYRERGQYQPKEGQQQQQREGQQQQGGEQQQQQQPQRQERQERQERPERQEQQQRGGQAPRGERPQGGNRDERPQGGRKPYGKGPQPKVNIADEAAFPKLG